jgi:glucose-1-phosphate adenylyltransferase
MNDIVALVLAGGRIGGYGVLTLNRAKAALPFAGHYRIIDFALTNLSDSGIHKIGIIIQYLPASLIEHVGAGHAWDLYGYGNLVKIMPPFVGVGTTAWYKGTTDAVYRNLNLVIDMNPDHTLILGGEHVYRMDFSDLLRFHEEKDADLTIVAKHLSPEQLSTRFGYLRTDDSSRVTLFKEKPSEPIGDFASLGIYLFKKDVLLSKLTDAIKHNPSYNLPTDIIEGMISSSRVFAFQFDGYWDYLETVQQYYNAQRLLLHPDSPIDLGAWVIKTNLEDRGLGFRTPTYLGRQSCIEDSLISPGCTIEGSVRRSILSPGVTVAPGAVVEDSILMHDCTVADGAHLKFVICDKDVIFEKGVSVGHNEDCACTNPELPPGTFPLTLIGKGVIVGEGIHVGAKSQIAPGTDLRSHNGETIPCGTNML